MLKRPLFHAAHQELRHHVGSFLDRVVLPHYAEWEAKGVTPRDAWLGAGEAGLLCPTLPAIYGGTGSDFLKSTVIIEEISKRRCTGFMTFLHSDIAVPYLSQLGTEAQKRKYLPGCVSGRILTALAITEPDSGSDVEGMQTRAEDDGEHYRIEGTKTHVSCGTIADLIIVAVRTGAREGNGKGLSLVVVEPRHSPGMSRTGIHKSAIRALDTATIRFDGCRVPKANLLGAEGMGFVYLMKLLVVERLALAISAQASSVQVLRDIVADCSNRATRRGSVLDYQHTRFALADALGEAELSQSFVDRCIADHQANDLQPHAACVAKLRATELLKQLALLAVQLRGARGTMIFETRSAGQDLLDACVHTVWGGTSEIMKEMISQNISRYA